MKRVLFGITIVLVLGLLLSCAPQATPAPSPAVTAPPAATTAAPKPAVTATTTAPVKPTTAPATPATRSWDDIVAAGKKEGTVLIMGGMVPSLQQGLRQGFTPKYGINIEFVIGRGAELTEKLRTERSAGLYLVDLHLGGATTATLQYLPGGYLDPMAHLLVLPEVTDTKNWFGGRLHWVDNAKKFIFTNSLYPGATLAVNTDIVKPGEIKSWKDVLNPKWKGQIVINDPTVAGNGARWFGATGSSIMDFNFMRDLVKQEPVFSRDQRLQVEWVARGKYAIILGPQVPNVTEFRKVGAPIGWILPAEGTHLSGGNTALSLSNKPAHPNAAQVFINWLLTKEGATILAKETLFQSARIDVPTDFLKPDEIRKPEVKYFISETEDFLKQQDEHMKLAKEIFGPIMK